MDRIPVPGKDGNKYVPFEKRTGESSVVFFTRDLSEKGLQKIYDCVSEVLTGKVAVKLHTGEPEGPNILPRVWVKDLLKNRLPDATIIET
ncbi:MAG: (Fe-S)-binding protein, partial [Butyrivibrio sp.]|nr:(Fe-S)-binding protein [Butyrivibrio sp.]